MVIKITDRVWAVTVEDTSVLNYARRPGHRQHIHGYVRWGEAGFQVYFSHVTQQSPDREARRQAPMVIPVPITQETSAIVRHCLIVEFSQVIFYPVLQSAQDLELGVDTGISDEDRAEMTGVMAELQTEIDSVEDGE